MQINLITLLLNITIGSFYILLLTYYFQIKEYRMDRFLSYLREKSFLELFIPNKIYKPKISTRNLIIDIFSLLVLLTTTFLTNNLISILLGVLAVIVGVLLTEPLAIWTRDKQINLAKQNLAKFKPVVIGITGSYGKTSTKEFLYQILRDEFQTEKTIENFNTNVGVAISINKKLTKDTKYFIAEIGAYKKGEIKTVTNWVKPKYGILTGLGNQHLDLFGSKQNLVSAKKELLDSLPKEGTAYVNADVENLDDALENLKCKIIKYSVQTNTSDIYIQNENVYYKKQIFNLKTQLNGKHNISNLLPCIALAYDLGISKEQIEKALQNITNEYGKLSMHLGINNLKILFDGKNSNFNGFISAIDVLQDLNAQKKLVVSKGIIELGSEKKASYIKILEKLDNTNITLITTDKLFKKVDKNDHVILVKNETEISNILEDSINNGAALLVEGRFTESFVNRLGIHK